MAVSEVRNATKYLIREFAEGRGRGGTHSRVRASVRLAEFDQAEGMTERNDRQSERKGETVRVSGGREAFSCRTDVAARAIFV